MSIKSSKLFTASVLISLAMHSVYAVPPTNLSVAKHAVSHYYDSGEYDKDVRLALKNAYQYLHQRVNENQHAIKQKKLAIVFDIDDTCITNFPRYRHEDFAHTPPIITAAFLAGEAPAIKPMLEFYNEAIRNGVAIFLISLRPEAVMSNTIRNLQQAGYFAWQALYLPKGADIKLPAQVYKTAIRKSLTAQGYEIILNIGDQETDLRGGYAERVIKIPNPIYSLVEESK